MGDRYWLQIRCGGCGEKNQTDNLKPEWERRVQELYYCSCDLVDDYDSPNAACLKHGKIFINLIALIDSLLSQTKEETKRELREKIEGMKTKHETKDICGHRLYKSCEVHNEALQEVLNLLK